MKTIAFNTGRQYAANGQIIIATLHDDGIVTFMDHARHIDGEFKLGQHCRFSAGEVLHCYDAGSSMYQGSGRSMKDGMQSGGCNTAPYADAEALLKGMRRMEEVVLAEPKVEAPAYLPKEGLEGLTVTELGEQLVLFCAHHGIAEASADELVNLCEGRVGSTLRPWLVAYSEAWDNSVEAKAAAESLDGMVTPPGGKSYTVTGDDDCSLFQSNSRNDCRMWVKGYTAHGDFGGHDQIIIRDTATWAELEVTNTADYEGDIDAAYYNEDTGADGKVDALDTDISDHAFSGKIPASEY